MDHVAILRKARISKGDNLLKDILDGRKTIESRWYVNKIVPWNKVSKNDTVYFKESGCPVTACATVDSVIQYENLSSDVVHEIIRKYGKQIAPGTSEQDFLAWTRQEVKKRFCILIFLKNVKKIPAFQISKKGFGISCAWLTVGNIGELRIL